MAEVAKASVTYCSNYNGCYVTLVHTDGTTVDESKTQEVADKIINKAYEECAPDGHFYGDIDELEEFVKETIHTAYGAQVEVTFEDDGLST